MLTMSCHIFRSMKLVAKAVIMIPSNKKLAPASFPCAIYPAIIVTLRRKIFRSI